MLLAEEIQLFPDHTIVYQLVIFLVVAVVLNLCVFKPILKIIHLRKSRTEGDRKKIEDLKHKSEKLLKEYEEKFQKAKVEALQIKETIRREGDEQGHRIVQEAKQASLSEIEKIRQEIGAASQKASEDLELKAKDLAKNLAEKILGRPDNKTN
ncbi:MAG: ATP synthase F0 subunit B [Deltaproteobacteria bacterium]|nr:ATP synthase F0 subunit B [Deltaproteobacteria bacterium]